MTDDELILLKIEAENKELKKALRDMLEYETGWVKLRGYSDCTCIDFSRKTEIAYELGKCPHQTARAAILLEKP